MWCKLTHYMAGIASSMVTVEHNPLLWLVLHHSAPLTLHVLWFPIWILCFKYWLQFNLSQQISLCSWWVNYSSTCLNPAANHRKRKEAIERISLSKCYFHITHVALCNILKIRIITLMMKEIFALWLVRDCDLSRYNHLARDNYTNRGVTFQNGWLSFVNVTKKVMNSTKEPCEEHKRCYL